MTGFLNVTIIWQDSWLKPSFARVPELHLRVWHESWLVKWKLIPLLYDLIPDTTCNFQCEYGFLVINKGSVQHINSNSNYFVFIYIKWSEWLFNNHDYYCWGKCKGKILKNWILYLNYKKFCIPKNIIILTIFSVSIFINLQ